MAQNNEIALKIIIDGIPTIINSVETLEAAIIKLRGVVETTADKSSDGFQVLESTLTALETKLSSVQSEAKQTGDAVSSSAQKGEDALDGMGNAASDAGKKIAKAGDEVKGVGFEKAFQSFAKVGSAVTSSFAAAQAAVGLFGGDTTKVAEAAAKAQQTLTLAIAAREVAEGVGALTTVKATIAQKAKNLADTASIGILRKLFAVIAANPYTALAVAIGAVVTALYFLVSAETEQEKKAKEVAESLKQMNKELEKIKFSASDIPERFSILQQSFFQGKISADEYSAALVNLNGDLKNLDLTTAEGQVTLMEYIAAQSELQELTDEIKLKESEIAKNREKGGEAARKTNNDLYAELERLLPLQAKALLVVNEFKKADEERGKTESENAEKRKKRDEERRAALLEQIRLTNELALADLKRYDALVKLEDIQVEFDTKSQVEELNALRESQEDYLNVIQKYSNLQKNFSESDLKRIKDTEAQITASGAKIDKVNKLLELGFKNAKTSLSTSDFKKLLKESYMIEEGVINDVETSFKNFEERAKFQKTFIDEYTQSRIKSSKNTGEALKEEEKGYRAQASALFDTLVKNEQAVLQYENSVVKLKGELQKLIAESEALKNSSEVLSGFLKANAGDIVNQFTVPIGDLESNRKAILDLDKEISTKRFDTAKNYQDEVTQLEKSLADQGFDISKASYETKLELLKLFLEKEVKAVEDAEKTKQEKQKESVDKFMETIQNFQMVLNSLQQTSSAFFNAQFDTLEKRYDRITEGIIGDTEMASQKRIEAEKAYNEERKKLEKQAAKTSLRIALAQAIANTAEAVAKTYAAYGGTPVGFGAAAVVAALNAVQAGIIASQLANVDSYRKGGRIKMAGGGLVTGPAHEYGGVKFQGGGIELEGNESVINRVSTVNYMGLLNQINQAGGGKPIMNNFDDSRIVEAIAKQRNSPIRAYVVESDISQSQITARRLEKLSQI